ncbi:MAG: SDR family oxidoreductase [Bacteroidetes bacterium]|nr:MAG: SDR family oxidoreductase [Bacteroidota bacterium]
MNIIVNGGSRGIGKEIVINLAQNINNQILVTGRNENALDNLASRFNNVSTMPLDLSVFDSYSESFRKTVYDRYTKVDILINMAGLVILKDFVDISTDDARLMMETNFFGPASMIRIVRPLMSEGSHIVNISSMGGFQGSQKYKGLSYYSASKAALACLTECLANEFIEFGISVNCLAPGAVQTEMFVEAFPGYKAPVNARDMAEFISDFAANGQKYFNGKILPVALNNP